MKAICPQFRKPSVRNHKLPFAKQRAYWSAIWLASLACGGVAGAQTTNTPASTAPPSSGGATNVTRLEGVTVVGQLDQARNQIVPDLGATTYTISKEQIAAIPQGEDAAFNQLLLRAPGMAEDSLGQLHLRGEHANVQYRINDVLLPEGITGFGPELDSRFIQSMRLITGSLPAQYGLRTAGIVDIQTKSGVFDPGGDVSMHGGTYDTLEPSFAYGGSEGKLNYFVDGSYNHNGIGIENPTSSSSPIHDTTDQYKMFSYLSYLLDDTSRISLILSASDSDFQIPNTPGLTGAFAGAPTLPATFDSTQLNERQNEQNYYGVIAYQKSLGDLNFQLAGFGRYSGVHFQPDPVGDLFFNGVASDVKREIYTGGFQGDFSYAINDSHTLRGGALVWEEIAPATTTTTVFNLDAMGNPIGAPFAIPDNTTTRGQFYGVYLQDEWKLTQKLTVNYGLRFDGISSYISQNQVSPRINGIYQPTDSTTLHAGYSRYFTPPPLELVRSSDIAKFNGTSNASTGQSDLVQSERAHYFDVGATQKLAPGLQVGLDGYYKIAKDELDDGFFGQTLILSPFNYEKATIYGVEFTSTYTKDGFSAYANLAYSHAQGENINSAQFILPPDVVAYSQNHYIFLDHDQRVTGSFGASYLWKETPGASTLFYVDALYGSGLRQDGVDSSGMTIPNGISVGSYYTLGVGIEQDFKIGRNQHLKARLDVVNLTDNVYPLRTGSGVGVNAAQYGERRGFFGTLTYLF